MSHFITFMAAPAIACLLFSVAFAYFGTHVLKREIIFVDLSLAQLAALGTTVAFVMDMELDSIFSQMISLVFVLIGSVFFSWSRTLALRLPQEAVIGIVYVVGASLSILIVDWSPHGAEHIKELLNGSILWVTWIGILKIFIVLSFAAAIHWKFRREFLELSNHYGKLPATRVGWDCVFYLTFGFVVAVSVKTAGIFLIFAFLIIPAACATFFFDSIKKQFLFGSAIGMGVSLIGLGISFVFDAPTGATLVCSFGVVFLGFLIFAGFTNR